MCFSSMCRTGNTRSRCRYIFTLREMVYLHNVTGGYSWKWFWNGRSSSFPVKTVSQILTGTLVFYFQQNISINVLKIHICDDPRSTSMLSSADWGAFLLLNWFKWCWKSTPMTQDVSLFFSCFLLGFQQRKKVYWSLSNFLHSQKAGWLFYSYISWWMINVYIRNLQNLTEL